MAKPIVNYDEISDTLYVSFEPGKNATGIELNDHILLRINKKERRAIGLTFLEYSLLAQKTEVGPRSFPLDGLSKLSDDLKELVIEILQASPVNEILSLSAYTPSVIETIPITMVHPLPVAAAQNLVLNETSFGDSFVGWLETRYPDVVFRLATDRFIPILFTAE